MQTEGKIGKQDSSTYFYFSPKKHIQIVYEKNGFIKFASFFAFPPECDAFEGHDHVTGPFATRSKNYMLSRSVDERILRL